MSFVILVALLEASREASSARRAASESTTAINICYTQLIVIPQSRAADGHAAPAAQQDLRDALERAALDVLVLVVDQL